MDDHNDVQVKLSASQKAQLTGIADSHGGKVPLHGRLFAQWLHYVFPRECPFPHKVGSATASTPSEFGDSYIANDEEVKQHAKNAKKPVTTDMAEDMQWMSQWSEEEELLTDYSKHLRSRFFGLKGLAAMFGGLGAVFVAMLWANGAIALPSKKDHGYGSLPRYNK